MRDAIILHGGVGSVSLLWVEEVMCDENIIPFYDTNMTAERKSLLDLHTIT